MLGCEGRPDGVRAKTTKGRVSNPSCEMRIIRGICGCSSIVEFENESKNGPHIDTLNDDCWASTPGGKNGEVGAGARGKTNVGWSDERGRWWRDVRGLRL